MRSPHVLIGIALDELANCYTHRADAVTERLIVKHYTAGNLQDEEFQHYCERLRRIAAQGKEVA